MEPVLSLEEETEPSEPDDVNHADKPPSQPPCIRPEELFGGWEETR